MDERKPLSPRHDHDHARTSQHALLLGIGLNALFVVAEVVAARLASSVSLLADAAHNGGDVVGLLLAWGAARLAERPRTTRRTYGMRRATILAALANGTALVAAAVLVGREAIDRLGQAHPVSGVGVAIVAAIGATVNGASALVLMHGGREDLNVRGALVHLVADAAVSAAVVVAGVVVATTGWAAADGICALAVSVAVLVTAWSFVRESLDLALDAVPRRIDPEEIERFLRSLEGVTEVHDLHIWPLSTTETALTVHLVTERGEGPSVRGLAHSLEERFSIAHTTIQIDPASSGDRACRSC